MQANTARGASRAQRWRLDTETQHFKRQEQVVKERIQRLDEQVRRPLVA